MKLPHFVCGSSAVLAGWLALTFVVHVPAPHYQKPGTAPAAASVTRDHATELVAAAAAQSENLQVSISR